MQLITLVVTCFYENVDSREPQQSIAWTN